MSVDWPASGTTGVGSIEAWGSSREPTAGKVLAWLTTRAASVSLNTWVAAGASAGSIDLGKLTVSFDS